MRVASTRECTVDFYLLRYTAYTREICTVWMRYGTAIGKFYRSIYTQVVQSDDKVRRGAASSGNTSGGKYVSQVFFSRVQF